MNKRTLLLYGFLLLLLFPLRANPVTEPEALRLATDFHQLRATTKLRSADILKLVWSGSNAGLRSTEVNPDLYIYNIGDNHGFVIVSGEDAVKTILGYSDEGAFQTENMPENLRNWLKFYQQEIEAVRAASASGASSTAVSTVASGTTTVAPLLGDIKWNQTEPFDLLCPWDAGDNAHALAGCVAVAMSQIMKYHRWPTTGTGTHTYTDANYGIQTVDYSKSTYDWDNMLGTYGSSATSVQNNAVATLIYQCGVAVNMAYSTTGSSSTISNAAEAFVSHFGYDAEIQRYERPNYTSGEWNNIIKNELNNARPVYFSANSDAGGHAFVCDGYDSNDLFHINWGWGGSSNGFFELSSLSSNNPGIVGAAPEYCYFQSILTNIHKADASTKSTNQVVLYKTGLSSSVSSVSKINTSSFALSFCFGNLGTNTVTARWGVGFVKEGSTTVTLLTAYSSTATTMASGSYYSTPRTITVSNPTGLASAGVYRLYAIYQPKDSTAWSIMRGTPVLNNCMVVTVASNNGPATIKPELDAPHLVLTAAAQPLSRLYQNKGLNVDLTVKNNGQEFFSRIGISLVNATDPGDRTYICESKVLVAAGETNTFHLSGTVASPPGNYYLEVQYDSTNSNSTMNYKTFGPIAYNSKLTEVLPPPGSPSLQLNNVLTMPNGIVVTQTDTIELKANITNAGGYFDSRIIAFVFPKAGGHSLTYLSPKYVYLDSLQTQEVTLTGTPNLEPGEYSFSLYSYQNNTWIFLSPGSMATIYFTVTDGSSSVAAPTSRLGMHVEGDRLVFDSEGDLRQIRMYDVFGRLVRSLSTGKEIPVGGLAKGLYLIELQSNGKTYHERFLRR